jgi:hypothetical protein
MIAVFCSLLLTLRSCVRSRTALELEELALLHQLHVLARSRPRQLHLSPTDRLLWAWLSRVWTDWRSALVIVTRRRHRRPTAAWTAQQLREAFPRDETPRYLIRDRDHAFDALPSTARPNLSEMELLVGTARKGQHY